MLVNDDFNSIFEKLSEAAVNIQYMYAFVSTTSKRLKLFLRVKP